MKIDDKYKDFNEREVKFYQDLKESLDSKSDTENQIDVELFEKQLASLQLISKDLDLPESLQSVLEDKPILKNINEKIVNDIFNNVLKLNSVKNSNFQQLAESFGIETRPFVNELGPLYGPLANFETENLISKKFQIV